MKTLQLIWIAGLFYVPVAGWYTAMLADVDGGAEATAAKSAEPPAEVVEAPPQPPAVLDELARTKADLAKLLAALQAPDANSAIENYTVLKSQVNELTAARDVATAALYKAGVANFEEATSRIAELTRQLADERRATDKSRKLVASLESLRDAQGWHSPSCPACPPANKTTTAAFGGATSDNPAPVAAPITPAQSGWVVVCYE